MHKVNQHKNQKKKKTVFPSNPGPNKHHTDSKVEITAFCQLGILEIQSLSIKTQKNQKKTEHSHTKKHKHNYLLAFKNKKKKGEAKRSVCFDRNGSKKVLHKN